MSNEQLIPTHGGYRKLKGFQVDQLAYDVTVRFVDRYIDRFSRTRDQMVQAARSGVQNIAEISANAALVLIGVACALLSRQSDTLAKQFEDEGGFSERLYRVRTQRRGR